MTLDDIFAELNRLNRVDTVRAMQFLANKLAAEELELSLAGDYPIYTPLGNEAVAHLLWDTLQKAEAEDRANPPSSDH
jgi:hypothetical protein